MKDPFDMSGGVHTMPNTPNSIIVGEYYYGVHCPGCKELNPVIKKINANLVGGTILTVCAEEKWSHKGKREMNPNIRGSFKHGGIEATPTVIWADDAKTVGIPFTQESGEMNEEEAEEYFCRRAAKCFLKEVRPGWGSDDIRELVNNVFEGRQAKIRGTGGEVIRHSAYRALNKISVNYA